ELRIVGDDSRVAPVGLLYYRRTAERHEITARVVGDHRPGAGFKPAAGREGRCKKLVGRTLKVLHAANDVEGIPRVFIHDFLHTAVEGDRAHEIPARAARTGVDGRVDVLEVNTGRIGRADDRIIITGAVVGHRLEHRPDVGVAIDPLRNPPRGRQLW